jgi:signal peptidase I
MKLRTLIGLVVLAALILCYVYAFHIVGIKTLTMVSSSMEPTIRKGEKIILSLKYYSDREPQRGDVVLYESPPDPEMKYMHRVVAVGGDSIEIKDKVLYVNGDIMTEPYVIHTDNVIRNRLTDERDNLGPVSVPADNIFVMGDNRDDADDSRFTGFLDIDAVEGKALLILWSDDRTRIAKIIN